MYTLGIRLVKLDLEDLDRLETRLVSRVSSEGNCLTGLRTDYIMNSSLPIVAKVMQFLSGTGLLSV